LLGIALDGDAPDHVALQGIRDDLDRSECTRKPEYPWRVSRGERLMGYIAGMATIALDEHRAKLDRPSRSIINASNTIDAAHKVSRWWCWT
jgi:hypothetical protein